MKWKEAISSGQDGFYRWYLEDEIPTQFDYDEVEVDLISEDKERKNDIHQFDLQAIETILNEIDFYIVQAIEHIKDCIRKTPELFRLADEEMEHIRKLAKENQYISIPDNDVEQYLSVSAQDFPVFMPNIIFYPDKTWMIRFVDSSLPAVSYGHGIGIFFNKKNEIVDLEIFPEE